MTNYGSWEGTWLGTGIALPSPPTVPTTPGTPPPHGPVYTMPHHGSTGLNIAVGLKSVAQLSLSAHFSVFLGITEVYNLSVAGRINNHFVIPGIN